MNTKMIECQHNMHTLMLLMISLVFFLISQRSYAADYQGEISFKFAGRCGGELAAFPYALGTAVPTSVCEPCVRKLISEQNIPNRQLKAITTCTTYNCSGCGSNWIFYANYQTQDTGSPFVNSWTADLAGIKVLQCKPGDTLISSSPQYFGTCRAACNPPSVWNAVTNSCAVLNKTPVNKCADQSPNPIIYSNGSKILDEIDYIFNGKDSVSFTRHYNSRVKTGNILSYFWLANVDALVVATSEVTVTGTQAMLSRPDGINLPFTFNGTNWVGDADSISELTELKDTNNNRIGWTYRVGMTGELESYNAQGLLASVAARNGNVLTITYFQNSRLISSISDPFGRAVKFTYDSFNRISTMLNPEGAVYTYEYDKSLNRNNFLTSVTYPDNTTKTYHYDYGGESTARKNALTGITDENGSRYMTYTYDIATVRATNEVSPSVGTDVNHYSIIYNPTNTVVTDARGNNNTYNFTTILGVVKSTGQSQPAGSGCAASASAITYDANGNTASRTDFNGNKTTYVYDMTRNLETSRTEGLTTTNAVTPATRTIQTTWHATWRLPLTISEYSDGTTNLTDGSGNPTGTLLKRTTYVYDTKGNVTSYKEEDIVRALSRTTTTTYTYSTAVPGLVLTKVVNGPRTDVTDTTTYTYYPHDATCVASAATPIVDPVTGTSPANLGCRGQLLSVKNALNQTTTYDRYNHHGQVEQMTDANGLVTTNTYDLRQRLLSRSISGSGITTQTTTLTYDNAGQVTQLTMPDNSSLTYTYDAAHRLTDIQDTLGNKVHYTLDGEGNRIQEDTTDPQGALAKTLTRSYDALNRLQTLTGQE